MTENPTFLFVFFAMPLTSVETLERFNSTSNNKHVWFSYANAFLHNILGKKTNGYFKKDSNNTQQRFTNHYTQFLLDLLKHTSQLILHSHQNIIHSSEYNSLITLPSGVLGTFHPNVSHIPDLTRANCERNSNVNFYLFWFKLDKTLSMIFQINSVYFSFGPICFFGNVTFANTDFVFCGQHFAFSLFPDNSSPGIHISAYICSVFKINISFLVVDKEQTITLKQNFLNSSNDKPFSVVKLENTNIVSLYHISTKKLHSLVLNTKRISDKNVLVYDGPDTSSILMQNKSFFLLSTFQCILQVVGKQMYNSSSILYNSNKICHNVYFSVDRNQTRNISMPEATCSQSPCSVLINARNHLNISILSMFYKGKQSQTCRYGGLLSVDLSNNSYWESNTLCKKDERDISAVMMGRSFYSFGNSLIVVLYWYKHLSKVQARLEIVETKCKFIYLCPCTYRFLILLQRGNQYISNLRHKEKVSPEINAILVAADTSTCVVLQMQQDENFATFYQNNRSLKTRRGFPKDQTFCVSKLRAKDVSGPEITTNIKARGVLDPLPLHSYLSHWRQCSCLRCLCGRSYFSFSCSYCRSKERSKVFSAPTFTKPFFKTFLLHRRLKGKIQMHNWGWMNYFVVYFKLNTNFWADYIFTAQTEKELFYSQLEDIFVSQRLKVSEVRHLFNFTHLN